MQEIKVIKRITGAHTVEDIPRIEQQIEEFSKRTGLKYGFDDISNCWRFEDGRTVMKPRDHREQSGTLVIRSTFALFYKNGDKTSVACRTEKPKIKDIEKGSWSTSYGNGLATYTITQQ